MGRIKSQIEYLQDKQNTVDTRLDNIDSKLEKLIASVIRLEALISHNKNKYLETPKPK
jgi:chromosome segregation ATPase